MSTIKDRPMNVFSFSFVCKDSRFTVRHGASNLGSGLIRNCNSAASDVFKMCNFHLSTTI